MEEAGPTRIPSTPGPRATPGVDRVTVNGIPLFDKVMGEVGSRHWHFFESRSSRANGRWMDHFNLAAFCAAMNECLHLSLRALTLTFVACTAPFLLATLSCDPENHV